MLFERTTGVYERICRERIICEFEIDFKKSFCCFCCSNLSNDYIISAHNGWQGWIET